MSFVPLTIDTLMRPAILVRAARCGQQYYRRARDLPRLLGLADPPCPAEATADLAEIEAELDARRRAGDGTYSVAEHVGILVALLAEARAERSDEGVGL